MEQHPVPQNVTTFQFRLIGDMTIKQFGYLAGGVILAYISFKLPLPFFFTWPLTIIFGIGGFGFAFVPVEERPMDVWVLSFIRSVYSPTQYLWQKEEPQPAVAKAVNPAQNSIPNQISPTPPAPRAVPDVVRNVFNLKNSSVQTGKPIATSVAQPVAQAQSPATRITQPQTKTTVTNLQASAWTRFLNFFWPQSPSVQHGGTSIPIGNFPMPSVTGRRIDLSPPPIVRPPAKIQQEAISQTQQKEQELEKKLVTLKKDLESKSMTEARVLELQKQLTEVLSQKEKMEHELDALRRQAAATQSAPGPTAPPAQPQQQTTPTTHVAAPSVPKTPTVKIITPESAVKAGLPRLTTFPNVVTGIIKDSENNFLPGVLVTVKDKEGIPLRALKTNRLGQFAASTPLANGVYFVEIEDPRVRYTFDRVQITLNGSVVPAIEIIAKSQKQISREKLAKEIFGDTKN